MGLSQVLVRRIAKKFGLSFGKAVTPETAFLAQVFILDNSFVLRGRPLQKSTVEEFENEHRLIEAVRPMIPFEMPSLRAIESGRPYHLEKGLLWTLHPRLKGKIAGSWQNAFSFPDTSLKKLLKAMATVHERTRGRFEKPDEPWLIRSLWQSWHRAEIFFTEKELRLILKTLDGVKQFFRNAPRSEMSFVHGDFHHGNVLFNRQGQASGLLDLNWCHVGHPLEDLTYMLMMYVSDYRQPIHQGSEKRLRHLIDMYDRNLAKNDLFESFYLLMMLFDVLTLAQLKSSESRTVLEYRVSQMKQRLHQFHG